MTRHKHEADPLANMDPEKLEAWLRGQRDIAPPLTDEQRRHIAEMNTLNFGKHARRRDDGAA